MTVEGNLLQKARSRTRLALEKGAIKSIPTESQFIRDGGVPFLLRKLPTLKEKDLLRAISNVQKNPFLPYDPDLFVADISESHVCLLNKYNVVECHLLIVTRDFERQESFLDLTDFEAFHTCLQEFAGLGFYNAGPAAGASQPHKHLQYVPLPLSPEGMPVPAAALFPGARALPSLEITSVPGFPFVNAFARIRFMAPPNPPKLEKVYRDMVHSIERGFFPHNLLLTRDWMLLVPRSAECFSGISVNALGFAGSLLVRNSHELATVQRFGPMSILRSVAMPK